MPPTLPVIYNTFHHGRIQLSLLSPQHGHDQMRHLLSSRNCSQILQGAGGKSGRWWDPVWVDSAAQGQHFYVHLLLGDAPSDVQSSGPARWLFAATGAGGYQQLCLAKEAGREQPERPVLCWVWICFIHQVCAPWAILWHPLAALRQVMLLKTSVTETFQPRLRNWRLIGVGLRSRGGSSEYRTGVMAQHLYSKHWQLHFISY